VQKLSGLTMFKQVPAQAWLLLAIGAPAYAPALYVYRYIVMSPSGRDITQPVEDLSWRTSPQFVRNVAILTALAALSVFIFTATAAQFAHSPNFLPILMIAGGAWSLFTVIRGFVTGQIEPLARGFHNTYQRETQPKRFWVSISWNAVFGFFLHLARFQNE
jgi:hypothetical protein